MGYDVYYVALEALKAAGSTDPAKVMEALPGVSCDGVSGHITFDENGDAVRDTVLYQDRLTPLPTYVEVRDAAEGFLSFCLGLRSKNPGGASAPPLGF